MIYVESLYIEREVGAAISVFNCSTNVMYMLSNNSLIMLLFTQQY
jgi:hypothetical protein